MKLGTGVPLAQARVAQIRQLSQQGQSIRKIARLTGISPGTVQKYIKLARPRAEHGES